MAVCVMGLGMINIIEDDSFQHIFIKFVDYCFRTDCKLTVNTEKDPYYAVLQYLDLIVIK